MKSRPQVSVVMGVFNAERFLRAAVDSVLQQTFGDFEFILVDDGSTDASLQILNSLHDPRIRILRNPINRGHPATLNRGLRAARAPLIARMDADDIAERRRLETQVAAMRAQPDLDVLGSWTTEIDEEGREIGEFSFRNSEALIRWAMTVTNVVYHPSVIMRLARLEAVGGYDEAVECADDYDLFTRVLISGGRIGLLPERLLRYRRSAGQISNARVEQQKAEALRVRQRYIAWLVGWTPPVVLVQAAERLQVPAGSPPEASVLAGAIRLTRQIRSRCIAGASGEDAGAVQQRSLEALLHHTERLREAGRTREAMWMWREAVRCGPRAWRRSLWGEGARLARSGGRMLLGRGGREDGGSARAEAAAKRAPGRRVHE